MATQSLVDYQVIFHGAFTLDASTPTREKTLNFSVPSDFVFASDSRKPILAFHAGPSQETRFKVFVNNREMFSWHLLADVVKGMWSPFSAREAFPEGSSFSDPVPIRILVSEGRITFENFVLWYQIDRQP